MAGAAAEEATHGGAAQHEEHHHAGGDPHSHLHVQAGVSPPGGVHQDGGSPMLGTAVAARRTAFRVFYVCNNVSLFTAICTVLVMVSIIPFKRRALVKMLSVAYKAVWVAVSFMAAAYVAAEVVIMQPPPSLPPREAGLSWPSVFQLSVSCGSLGAVLVGVTIVWVKHMLMKRKWRKQNPRRRSRRQSAGRNKVEEYMRQLPPPPPTADADAVVSEAATSAAAEKREDSSDGEEDSSSDDSDMVASRERGYHTY